MVRRTLLVAGMILFLWAAPAAAQYGGVFGEGEGRQPPAGAFFVVEGADTEVRIAGFDADGELARTGSNNLVPLVEAGIVLIGGGSLLALVARRRRTQRQLAST